MTFTIAVAILAEAIWSLVASGYGVSLAWVSFDAAEAANGSLFAGSLFLSVICIESSFRHGRAMVDTYHTAGDWS